MKIVKIDSFFFLSSMQDIITRYTFYFSVNKQINDKERIAAAMENPNLRDLVNKCISDEG